MTIELLYGRSTLPVRPPDGCVPTVIEKRAMPVLADPPAAVERRPGRAGRRAVAARGRPR